MTTIINSVPGMRNIPDEANKSDLDEEADAMQEQQDNTKEGKRKEETSGKVNEMVNERITTLEESLKRMIGLFAKTVDGTAADVTGIYISEHPFREALKRVTSDAAKQIELQRNEKERAELTELMGRTTISTVKDVIKENNANRNEPEPDLSLAS